MKKSLISAIIVFSIVIISLSGLTGCTSSEKEEQRAKQLEKIRVDVENLKQQNNNADASLDSLNTVLKRKDEELRKLQQELDSLQKNIEQESNK